MNSEATFDPTTGAGPAAPPPAAEARPAPELPRPLVLKRIFFSAFYAVMIQLVSGLVAVLLIFELLFGLVTQKRPHARVRRLGATLSSYLHDLFRYLTFNLDEPPYPFSDLSESPEEDSVA